MWFVRSLLFGLSSFVFLLPAFGQSGQNQSFVSSYSPGTLRNNYSGFVGMQFTVGSAPITITALGRMNPKCCESVSSTYVHTLKLVNAATSTDVPGGSVQVTLTELGTANVFTYAELAAPVQLQANTTYDLLSQETSGFDYWYDFGPVTTTNIATVTGAVYTDAASRPVLLPNTAGQSYVPVTFLYGSANPVIPPPTVAVSYDPNGAGYPPLVANASSLLGTIASVQFQLNNENYGPAVTTGTAGIYTAGSITNFGLLNGTYSLTAIATDSFGQSTTSVPVPFTYTGSSLLPLLTGQTLGALRNDYGNPYGHFVGMEFTVGSEHLNVFELGRYAAPGNSQTHLLKLVNAATGIDVPGGSVSVSMAGSTAGQYVYGYLVNPVFLPANTSYYLVSQETIGGDQWYNYAPVAPGTLGTVAGGVYQADSGAFILVKNSAGFSYGPLNLAAAPVPPPYTIGVVLTTQPNATYSLVVAVGATVTPASSALPIQTVQFEVDGQPFGAPAVATSGASNYGSFLDTTKLTNGSHTLSVVATDIGGDSATSGSQSFTVNNSAISSPGQAFVTAFNSTASQRNNYSGWVGMQFTTGGSPVTISSLGRYCAAGNQFTHTLKLVSAANGSDVAGGSVSVSMANCYLYGGFAYAPLASPVTLPAGTSYYLVSQETSGGELWLDYTPVTTTAVATVNGPVYTNGAIYVTVPGALSYSYGPVNFLSTTVSTSALSVSIAMVSGTVTAAAVSPGKIVGVQFQIDGTPIYATMTNAPYTMNLPALSYGVHQITAVAYDSLGNTATSNAIPYTVFCYNCNLYGEGFFRVSLLNFSGTTLRNNYTGWVGFQFTTLAFGGLGDLGFPCEAGSHQTHFAKIVLASTGADVPGGTMWFDCSNQSGQTIFPSAGLSPNTSYYLVVQETSGGDKWYDISPATPMNFYGGQYQTSAYAGFTVDGPVYWNGLQYVLVPTPNYSYVGIGIYGWTSSI